MATVRERIMARIIVDENGCWVWQGSKNNKGYGTVSWVGHDRYVHRIMCGEIPDGHEVDHLCRNHACCNPDHLEAVTHAENLRRGAVNQHKGRTHCQRGHEWTEENTRITPDGSRLCRTCRRDSDRRRRELQRQAKNTG